MIDPASLVRLIDDAPSMPPIRTATAHVWACWTASATPDELRAIASDLLTLAAHREARDA